MLCPKHLYDMPETLWASVTVVNAHMPVSKNKLGCSDMAPSVELLVPHHVIIAAIDQLSSVVWSLSVCGECLTGLICTHTGLQIQQSRRCKPFDCRSGTSSVDLVGSLLSGSFSGEVVDCIFGIYAKD